MKRAHRCSAKAIGSARARILFSKVEDAVIDAQIAALSR